LTFLAKDAGLYDNMAEAQKDFIDLVEPLNVEARYPTHKGKLMQTLDYERCREILRARRELKRLGVIRSNKWHSEFGEWLVSQLLEVRRSDNRNQQGVDLKEQGYQVKTHFIPAPGIPVYEDFKGNKLEFENLVIVGLDEAMKVQVIYKVEREFVEQNLAGPTYPRLDWLMLHRNGKGWDVRNLPTFNRLERFFELK
jgi:hypothetical protein